MLKGKAYEHAAIWFCMYQDFVSDNTLYSTTAFCDNSSIIEEIAK